METEPNSIFCMLCGCEILTEEDVEDIIKTIGRDDEIICTSCKEEQDRWIEKQIELFGAEED